MTKFISAAFLCNRAGSCAKVPMGYGRAEPQQRIGDLAGRRRTPIKAWRFSSGPTSLSTSSSALRLIRAGDYFVSAAPCHDPDQLEVAIIGQPVFFSPLLA
jgi:hypothetical protein